MKPQEAISILERLQEPEAWEPQISRDAYEALELAIEALEDREQIFHLECLRCKKPVGTYSRQTMEQVSYTHYSYCEDCLRKGLKMLKKQDALDKQSASSEQVDKNRLMSYLNDLRLTYSPCPKDDDKVLALYEFIGNLMDEIESWDDVDQFRDSAKKTDEESISKQEALTNMRTLCDGCYLMEHCGQCNSNCLLRKAMDVVEKIKTDSERVSLSEQKNSNSFPEEPSEDSDSEINCSDEWWKNYIRSRMSRDDVPDTNVEKIPYKKPEIICDPDCEGFVCHKNGIYGWCPKAERWGCEYFYELERRTNDSD